VTVGAIVVATADDRRSGVALDRLVSQLGALGVGPVDVVPAQAGRVRAALDAAETERTIVVDAGIVVHDQAVRSLTEDPRLRTAALVDGERFLDLLVVDGPDRVQLAASGTAAMSTADVHAELVGAGRTVSPVQLRLLYWAHPESVQATAAIEAAKSLDEDRLWLDSAVKADDGFFGTFFVSPYSRFIARWAARRRIKPNTVTAVALVLALIAAASFAAGHRADRISGAVVLFAAFVLDCVDGQLARYARAFTALGAWLDVTTDRVKEYAVYAGLAIGASRVTGSDVWVLAAAAMCLQTVRHLLDHTFPSGLGGATGRRRPPWSHWPRKLALLPIGERFAVICVTALFWSPRTTFLVLLVWGAVAVCYGNAGRLRRSLS
jgi:phosphatidylglycerophosphate synthase